MARILALLARLRGFAGALRRRLQMQKSPSFSRVSLASSLRRQPALCPRLATLQTAAPLLIYPTQYSTAVSCSPEAPPWAC